MHAVKYLRALSPDTSISDTATPDAATIRYRQNGEVALTYDLVKDWTGPLVYPFQFHPVLMPNYLEINGANALVHPKLEARSLVTSNFDWQKLPTDWALATSFGTTAGPEGRCQSYSGPWRAVETALFAAGEFRIHHFQIASQPAVLAVRGQWTFTDEEAVADIQKAVSIVRDFWHDHNFPYFLVTLKPYDIGKGSSDGSEFTNAFWMYLSPPDSISALLPVLAHETFHGWNPRRMGYTTGGTETSLKWFSEGFTQYYGYLLSYRSGLMTLPAYLERINGYLRDYAKSTDPDVRGPVIALWLDGEIRRESQGEHSLDNVMFDMVRKGKDTELTEARILETADRYLSADVRRQLGQAIEPGAMIPVPDASALGACVRVSIDRVPVFVLGFDFEASMAAHRVTAVKEDGPAFKAGLRDGQELNGWSVYNNQPDRLATFHIDTAMGHQTIQYYPRETTTAPQYHLDQRAFADDPAACQRH
jgi:predicted metalloprotease with PDZ domain